MTERPYLDECPDCGRDNCRCDYDPDRFRDEQIAWDMETNA